MDLTDFFNNVENDTELAGISVDNESKSLVVEHLPTKLCTVLPVLAVEQADWSLIRDILVGNREPTVLYHMTRIVGYYSRVENWNRSKLGEMKARIKGHYSLEGANSSDAIKDRLDTVEQIQKG